MQVVVYDKNDEVQMHTDWVPPKEMVVEAHQHMQAIVAISHERVEMDERLKAQLSWFAGGGDRELSVQRCKAAGYDNLRMLLGDEHVATAIWGRTDTSRTDRFRMQRLVFLGAVFQPADEVDVLGTLPRSIASTPMLHVIEKEAAALPAPDDPERPQALEKFKALLEEAGNRTHRENVAVGKETLRKEFTYDPKSGIVTFTNGHGPVEALQLNPKAGPVAAVVLNRIIPIPIGNLTMDADKMTAWVADQPITVGKVLTADEHTLNALADITHANRA